MDRMCTVPEESPPASYLGRLQDVAEAFGSLPASAVAMEGPDARIAAANGTLLANMPPSFELGVPLLEAVPAMQGQLIKDMVDRVMRSGEPAVGYEWRLNYGTQGPDTPDIVMDFRVDPWRWPDGSLRGAVGWGVDVTERARAREARELESEGGELRHLEARDVVAHLQQALLPTDVPVLPQLEVSARYLVAAHEQSAGGDWYDAIPLDDGRVALVLGDVVGHGVTASAVMGQLRAVLIDLLTSDVALPGVVRRMHRFSDRVPAAYGTTLCVVLLDQHTGEMEYVSLAHPPGLVVSPDGAVRRLPGTGDGPVGTATGEPSDPTVEHAVLAEGEVLLLYSDGLVERPGVPLEEAMTVLGEVASNATTRSIRPHVAMDRPTERVAQLTVDLLTRTGYTDDVTVLAAQRRAEPVQRFETELTGDYGQLSTTRRSFAAWLDQVGVAGSDEMELQVAVTEALTNAMEHAYADSDQPGAIRFEATLRANGVLAGTVTDHGAWREREARPHDHSDERGRGLTMINRFTDDFEIVRSPQGSAVNFLKRLRRPAGLSQRRGAVAYPPVDTDVPFEVTQDEAAPGLLTVTGPVDAATSGQLELRLAQVSRAGSRSVTVDLSRVSHLASTGVQVLHRFRQLAGQQGTSFRLVAGPGSPARPVLDLVNLPYQQSVPHLVTEG